MNSQEERNDNGVCADNIAVSTRVRLARNLTDFPFPHRMNHEKAQEMLERVAGLFPSEGVKPFRLVQITPSNRLEARMLVEKHLISPELFGLQRPCGVVLSEDESVSVMVGEEDHIRIQVLHPGLSLNACLQEAFALDDRLDSALSYAFNEHLGYLTACPTNLGTALRASVMLHLSVLTESGAIREIVNVVGKMGLAVRGLYGEGSQIQGALYQVSNQNSLGLSEQEIIGRVMAVVEHIISQEQTLRQQYKTRQKSDFQNRVWRAWGILTHARLLSGAEAMALLSDIRLGVSEGELPAVPMLKLNDLLGEIQIGALTQVVGHVMDSGERDAARAETVRTALREYA